MDGARGRHELCLWGASEAVIKVRMRYPGAGWIPCEWFSHRRATRMETDADAQWRCEFAYIQGLLGVWTLDPIGP